MTRLCRACNQEFTPKKRRQVFCGRKCSLPFKRVRPKAKHCEQCGKTFIVTGRAEARRATCSDRCRFALMGASITKPPRKTTCPGCEQPFETKTKSKTFCSNGCASRFHMRNPEHRKKLEYSWQNKTDVQRAVASQRFHVLNQDPLIKAKHAAHSERMRGSGFAGLRGGNGTLTKQQEMLATVTGYVTEYPVPTGNPSWKYAVVDLAKPERKLAIEVDGRSHQTRQQRSRDKIKERILRELGWTLLRIRNDEVDQHIDVLAGVIKTWEETHEPGIKCQASQLNLGAANMGPDALRPALPVALSGAPNFALPASRKRAKPDRGQTPTTRPLPAPGPTDWGDESDPEFAEAMRKMAAWVQQQKPKRPEEHKDADELARMFSALRAREADSTSDDWHW
jgi:Protein of unknown function (DUF559)